MVTYVSIFAAKCGHFLIPEETETTFYYQSLGSNRQEVLEYLPKSIEEYYDKDLVSHFKGFS